MRWPVREGASELANLLMSFPGVIGVFWSQRRREGEWLRQRCLSIHVRWKRPPELLPVSEMLPDRLSPFELDVIEVGLPRVHALSQTDTVVVDGLARPRFATMTALAPTDESVLMLLSGHAALPVRNNRIFTDYGPGAPQAFVRVNDEDGSWYRGILRHGELGEGRPVDWALAEVFNVPDAVPFHYGTRDTPPFALRTSPLQGGELVSHFSRTRDRLVKGTLRGVSQTPVELLLPDGRTTTYSDVLTVESSLEVDFSRDGDSGSLVVDGDRKVIGTMLGASADYSMAYVLQMPPLLARLGSYRPYFFL